MRLSRPLSAFIQWQATAGLGLSLCFSSCRGGEPTTARSTENLRGVVFVVVDTLRADHVGAYGSSQGLTSNLDALAARSYVFENAAATSSWTRPSVASMLTSRYPTALGIHDGEDVLDGEAFATLPALLKARAGFQTFGTATNGNTSADFGFGHGFDAYELPNLKRSYPGDYAIPIAPGVTQKALELLDRWNGERPFFLFVHYVDPHDPYLPHPGLLPDAEPDGRFDGSRRELSLMDPIPKSELTGDDYARIQYLYAGEVKYVDRHFGELLNGLKDRGLEDSVIFVVASDHGEGLWSHGIRFHGVDLYEETIAVPLILRFPGMTAGSAKRISAPVSLVDVAPTILAALEIPKPETFQGRDLTPLLLGEWADRESEPLYAEMDRGGRSFESIRRGAMKLVRKRTSRTEGDGAAGVPERQIFDLEQDPGETANLVGRASAVEKRLETILTEREAFLSSTAPGSPEEDVSSLEPSTIDSLKALGYLDASEPAAASSRREDALMPPSVLDFEDGRRAHRRDLQGFHWTEDEGRPWMGTGRDASVVLGRAPTQTRWSVRGSLDPSRHEGGPLRVTVWTDDSPASTFRIEEAGMYSLEGDLPPAATAESMVRLRIRCDRESTVDAPPSHEEVCMSLSTVGLY
ncbi:MAG: sulfatase [Vicinamibacteria bacterium]